MMRKPERGWQNGAWTQKIMYKMCFADEHRLCHCGERKMWYEMEARSSKEFWTWQRWLTPYSKSSEREGNSKSWRPKLFSGA